MKNQTKWLLAAGALVVVTRPEIRAKLPFLDEAYKALDGVFRTTSGRTAQAASEALEAAMGGATDILSASPPFAGTPGQQIGGSGSIPPLMPPGIYLDQDGANGQSLPFFSPTPFWQIAQKEAA